MKKLFSFRQCFSGKSFKERFEKFNNFDIIAKNFERHFKRTVPFKEEYYKPIETIKLSEIETIPVLKNSNQVFNDYYHLQFTTTITKWILGFYTLWSAYHLRFLRTLIPGYFFLIIRTFQKLVYSGGVCVIFKLDILKDGKTVLVSTIQPELYTTEEEEKSSKTELKDQEKKKDTSPNAFFGLRMFKCDISEFRILTDEEKNNAFEEILKYYNIEGKIIDKIRKRMDKYMIAFINPDNVFLISKESTIIQPELYDALKCSKYVDLKDAKFENILLGTTNPKRIYSKFFKYLKYFKFK
jgi:hypothetical protein